jgi:hypothetical protein
MPHITENRRPDLWAHCQNSLCKGYVQRPVAGIESESAWTFKELSGNAPQALPGVERTVRQLRFEREEDSLCPVCGGPREITADRRPEYPAISGYPASESLRWFGTFTPGAERSAEVEAALARLEEAVKAE